MKRTDRQSGRVQTRTWFAIGGVVVAVGLMVIVFAARFGMDVSFVASPLVGRDAPSLEFVQLTNPEILATDDLMGRVVVMNFWASWCPPCRTEHRALTATSARYADRGVRFLGVVHQDDPDSAMAFLDEMGWGENYDYVIGDGSGAAIEYGIYGLPETFVIDARGVIAAKITGVVTTESLAAAIEVAQLSGAETESEPAP